MESLFAMNAVQRESILAIQRGEVRQFLRLIRNSDAAHEPSPRYKTRLLTVGRLVIHIPLAATTSHKARQMNVTDSANPISKAVFDLRTT